MKARTALRGFAWLTLAAVAAVGIVFAINVRDESPDERYVALRKLAEPAIVPPRENAYLALLGLPALPDSDPVEEAREAVAESERLAALPAVERIAHFQRALASHKSPNADRLTLSGQRPIDCSPVASPCLVRARRSPGGVREQVAANRVMVDRYVQAIALARFEELADTVVGMTWPHAHYNVQRLLLQRAAVDAVEGRVADAIGFLERDIAFWRRVIASGPSLIVTMMTVRNLQNDLALLGELVADPAIDLAPHHVAIDRLLADLVEGAGYRRTLAREMATGAALVQDLFDTRNDLPSQLWTERVRMAFDRRFMRPQATFNRMAVQASTLADAAQPFPDACARMPHVANVLDAYAEPTIDWLFNPIGKWVAGSIGRHAEYPLRICDAANELRLVRALNALRAGPTLPADVESFLAARADLDDLYTGRPFAWSPGARALSFTPRGSRRPIEAGDVRAYLPV